MLVWFSCGAPSAVASQLALNHHGTTHEVCIVNCDTRASEHPDNYRFSQECEAWLCHPITYINSEKYTTVDEVFDKTRYMSGIAGARCTTELKKVPRQNFARPEDIHVFGYTVEETKRARTFRDRNPELNLRWLLIEHLVSKQDCLNLIAKAGIELPAMYRLGYNNNNCPGCVKASAPWYWDKIRTDFPELFKRRCEQSRALGVRLVEIHHHDRIFLDELPPGPFKVRKKGEDLSCGPECGSPGVKEAHAA